MTNVLDRFNLQGRTALVTGGAGLLGSGFSRTLAQAGAAVAVADLDLAAAQDVADSSPKRAGRRWRSRSMSRMPAPHARP